MFSNGIVILGTMAALLVVLVHGSTHALIPLYAVGVFVSFTLSQAGMVRRWLARRETGWWWRWWVNALGATTTGVVMLVIAATKFARGAWMVVVLIPILMAGFVAIRRHYADVAGQLSLERFRSGPPIEHTVLIKGVLLFRKRVAVVGVPFHLTDRGPGHDPAAVARTSNRDGGP